MAAADTPAFRNNHDIQPRHIGASTRQYTLFIISLLQLFLIVFSPALPNESMTITRTLSPLCCPDRSHPCARLRAPLLSFLLFLYLVYVPLEHKIQTRRMVHPPPRISGLPIHVLPGAYWTSWNQHTNTFSSSSFSLSRRRDDSHLQPWPHSTATATPCSLVLPQ